MDFNKYQELAKALAVFPAEQWKSYLPLQLASEAGEVAGKFGKSFRGDKPIDLDEVAKELGDVLWYIANLAFFCGFTLEEIATGNIDKLTDRKQRGVLKGNGDNR